MTDDELVQFEALAKKYERGKDKERVKKIISESVHEVFQDINDGGHSAATKAKQAEIEKLETENKGLKDRADTAEGKLRAFDDQAPDVAKVRKTYEDNEARLRKEYDDKLREQGEAHTKALQQKDTELLESKLAFAKKNLVDKLSASKLGIDKEYAETVLLEKPEVKERLKADNGQVKVLQRGSKDMYIVPAEGKDALDHFAEELAENVEAKWKVSGGGRGSGTHGSEGGSGTGNLAQRFDDTRKRVKEREEEAAKVKGNGSGLERLGSRR